jgi:hypothetical protein
MRPTTKDLLRVRDGEPVDAVLSSEVTSDPELQQEVRRLRDVQVGLCNLPDLAPPLDIWERIESAATQSQQAKTPARFPWPRWVATVGAAASVALVAVMLVNETTELPSETTVGGNEIGQSNLAQNLVTPRLASLRDESRRLERVVAGFGDAPALVNVATAGSIADVQDRILWIDDRLSRARLDGLSMVQLEALWRERVQLMSSLAALRYAQAQRFAF